MAQMDQHHNHHGNPRVDTIDSPQSYQTPLTSATLQQLRRSDEESPNSQPVSPIMSRRASMESDRFSIVSGLTSYFPSNPTNANPPPAYVAPFGASQVVSEHQLSTQRPSSDEDEEDKPNKDDVQFSESALALINAFLDQLLYSFLSTARSTSLFALRPAVTDVLKHRLAREAIASAEEELAELLGGGEDEEDLDTKHREKEHNRRWDLELVWKRTRLRVMVYMRLGEMEDEDEQHYVKEEELFQGIERRFSQSSGLVSWAAAIFLTSVLEYVAEQTLQVAGQAATTRARRQGRSQRTAFTDAQPTQDLTVEEHDVEKVALSSTLGRLWRTWRKALRNNTGPNTPTHRSSHSISRIAMRNNSFSTAQEESAPGGSRPISRDQVDSIAEMQYPEHILAANIPLPMGDPTRDTDEIVVPGLGRSPDDEYDEDEASQVPYRGEELGALVALPIGEDKRDIDEIEVPGLAKDPDSEEEHDGRRSPLPNVMRRNSFAGVLPYRNMAGLPIPEVSNASSLIEDDALPPARLRSSSLPKTVKTPMLKDDTPSDSQIEVVDNVSHQQDDGMSTGDQDKSIEEEPRALEAEAQPEEYATAMESSDDKRKSEFPWMVGGAAVASAAAAGAWALGSRTTESQQSSESGGRDSARLRPNVERAGSRGLGGLIRSASRDDHRKDENIDHNKLLDVGEGSSQRSLSDKDIEELDKRKSLIDIKAMMGVNSASGSGSGQQSPSIAQSPSAIVRQSSVESSESKSSYSGDRGSTGDVSEQEGPDYGIGVARTADVAAAVTPGAMRTPDDPEQARDASKLPPRLIIDDGSKSTDGSTTNQGELTPRTVQRQFLDLSSETDALESQPPPEGSRPRSSSRPSQRANLANGAQQSPAVASSPYRQSLTAPVEKNESVGHREQSSESPTQDHPVIQRMASIKNEPKSPRSPKAVNDSEKPMALTSASIRGPEDFDSFVQGADTVKYTLTPENVRDEPILNTTLYQKAGGSPVEMDATSSSRQGRSPVARQATSAFNEEDYQASKRRSISRPSPRNTSSHRKSGLMAREPRILTESTRDFADFIRSTGPGKESTVYPILANASTTSLHSLRSAHIYGASASRSTSPNGERTKSFTKSMDEDANVPPVPPVPTPKRSRTTMQARGATSTSGGSAELIDFIRSGPDQAGKHRISRTVAPFRSTMDSDQFHDLSTRTSTERASVPRMTPAVASVQSVSSLKSSSQRTSVNSRSALLHNSGNANKTVQPAYSGQPQRLSQSSSAVPKTTVAQENEPVRKRHRNKDPYAMYYDDLDDEDEELLTSLPKTSRKDESLVDFLNNNEPPSNTTPRPLINPNSAQAQNIINQARASTNSTQKPVQAAAGAPRTSSNSANPRSGYASPAQSMQSARQAPINNAVTAPASGKAKMQARGGAKEIATDSNTRDLADFLKASAPEDLQSAPAPIVGRDSKLATKEVEKAKKKAEKKKSGGFFGRTRKKTYLDLP